MNYAILIPARYESTRLPGKPLIKIAGKAMIQRTWERCCQAVSSEKVYVATDNLEIKKAVLGFGGQVVMTSSSCLTGTDRLAEANKILDFDFIINVQGDEPIINPEDIKVVIEAYKKQPETVVNAMAPIKNKEEFFSLTVPKVVFDEEKNLLYMSRSPIPGSKDAKFNFGYKQVCIYAFSKMHLEYFCRTSKKTLFEEVEDIEILRFLEGGVKVRMIEVQGGSIAVDVPNDVLKVESFLAQG
ncbi:MAG: 3-deoxy-manno-octulosonate cytidylyltransferase [Neptuniibacter sp.]